MSLNVPPPPDRCQAMLAKPPMGGERCRRGAEDGRLCVIHLRAGALIPDAWTPTGIPVFYLRTPPTVIGEATSPTKGTES